MNDPTGIAHPRLNRRELLRVGGIGVLGLSSEGVQRQRALGASHGVGPTLSGNPKKVVYIFLPGGPPQHETFDPKPDAPDAIRGEFKAIETRTPGMLIGEHLPLLAQQSDKFALLRSVHHRSNDHIAGTTIMTSGDTRVPTVTAASKVPDANDAPGIVALAGHYRSGSNNLPGSAVVPQYVESGTGTGRVVSGQLGGKLGSKHDPWLIKAASNCLGWGACPNCFEDGDDDAVFAFGLQFTHSVPGPVFQAPTFRLPSGVTERRLGKRLSLVEDFERRRADLNRLAGAGSHDRFRDQAVALLTSPNVRRALDLRNEDPRLLDAYGRNKFGWSLLLTRRLLEAGVNMVQTSLGRNGTWDLHRRMYPLLTDFLLPPTDQAVSCFLEDLSQRGLLDDTLVVLCGEFGRTPRISSPSAGRRPGRDHWGPLQSILLAGGGVTGGAIVGSSDRIGGYPVDAPKTPEDLAATIFDALGIPGDAIYRDRLGRPQQVYLGTPIRELYA